MNGVGSMRVIKIYVLRFVRTYLIVRDDKNSKR